MRAKDASQPKAAPDSTLSEITLPTDRVIAIRRVFDAPRRVVFEAWTDPEHVAQWWDPTGVQLAVCEIDLRPNGAFRWVHRASGGGEGHAFTGIYREITPPEKLVFEVRSFANGADPIGTILFSEVGKRTTVTLTIECATARDRDTLLQMRIDKGTARTLDNLAAHLLRKDP
jgi:uncharacterized protein YndB with AHSA1/START domain